MSHSTQPFRWYRICHPQCQRCGFVRTDPNLVQRRLSLPLAQRRTMEVETISKRWTSSRSWSRLSTPLSSWVDDISFFCFNSFWSVEKLFREPSKVEDNVQFQTSSWPLLTTSLVQVSEKWSEQMKALQLVIDGLGPTPKVKAGCDVHDIVAACKGFLRLPGSHLQVLMGSLKVVSLLAEGMRSVPVLIV